MFADKVVLAASLLIFGVSDNRGAMADTTATVAELEELLSTQEGTLQIQQDTIASLGKRIAILEGEYPDISRFKGDEILCYSKKFQVISCF